MKKLVLLTGFVLISIMFQTCREEEPMNLKNGKVQFAFRASATDNSGGRVLAEIPDGAVLFLSLNFTADIPALYLEKVTLLKFGDEFISSPVTISEGEYRIIDFIITNANHEVLFATPRENSLLAPLVSNPVPNIIFTVTKDEITNIPVDVIAVEGHSAGDFGYEYSFGIEPINQEAFQLAVFTPGENGEVHPTGAMAYILHEEDTIVETYLLPSVNGIVFDADPDEFYTLALIEPSYKKYSRTFRINDLKEELDGDPLSIILSPAFTLTVSGGSEVNLQITTNPTIIGELHIDWGDGESDVVQLPIQVLSWPTHLYNSLPSQFISVSGNLEAIEEFQNFGDFDIRSISVRYLPNLRYLGIGFCPALTEIDISHNKKLTGANFTEVSITTLDVSQNKLLKQLNIDVMYNFPPSAIDAVIHDLRYHAMHHNLTHGSLHISKDWSASGLTGPPSATGLAELHELHDTYGWYVFPEEF